MVQEATNEVTRKKNPDLTREKILQAAFTEIHEKGFRSASLDCILSHAGVTKGALYHHFGNKNELGYAVVDEIIREHMLENMIRPLLQSEDPIETMLSNLASMKEGCCSRSLECGCPLNNLAMEMSPVDEGFRTRIESIFCLWRDALSEALRNGQGNRTVRPDIDTGKTALFLISACEGLWTMTKSAQDLEVMDSCIYGLSQYLDSLRIQKPIQ